PVLVDARDGLSRQRDPAVRALGRLACAQGFARALEVVSATRRVGCCHALSDEHRGLAADRERPTALDRAGPDEDRERQLAFGDADRHLDQPVRLRGCLPVPRRRRPRAHAALRAQRHRRPGARGRSRRPGHELLGHAMLHLHTLWFIIIAILWIGFFVLEGFDFGVGMLQTLVGRTEPERELVVSTIGPWWDGNEVWLIVAAAGMFAA